MLLVAMPLTPMEKEPIRNMILLKGKGTELPIELHTTMRWLNILANILGTFCNHPKPK